MEWMQSLQKREIDFIVYIQNAFFKHENILEVFSTVFGSTFLYVYVIPCLAALNAKLYHKTLCCCLVSDFLNLVLKWALSEDRPYWWVHETKVYTSLTRPTLYQTERTCETSPGSPSGHLMVASSFLYVMLLASEKLIVLHCHRYRRQLRYLARTIFAMTLALLAVSRMYFATHFFHQCVFGAVLGICISETFIFTKFTDTVQLTQKPMWFKVACAMVAMVTSIFWLHKLFSGNPMASVQLAFKHCNDPLYPKPETTVIFACIRTIAKVAGIWMAAPLKSVAPSELRFNYSKSIPLTACIVFAQRQFILNTPTTYKFLIFYSYTFVVYAVFQYLTITMIPKFCAKKVDQRPKTN